MDFQQHYRFAFVPSLQPGKAASVRVMLMAVMRYLATREWIALMSQLLEREQCVDPVQWDLVEMGKSVWVHLKLSNLNPSHPLARIGPPFSPRSTHRHTRNYSHAHTHTHTHNHTHTHTHTYTHTTHTHTYNHILTPRTYYSHHIHTKHKKQYTQHTSHTPHTPHTPIPCKEKH